jgi:hypothetical protein
MGPASGHPTLFLRPWSFSSSKLSFELGLRTFRHLLRRSHREPDAPPSTTWPPPTGPGEGRLERGAKSLGTGELFAILLRTGLQGASAVEIGNQLVAAV